MWRNDDPTASPTLPTPGAPGTPGYYDDGTIVTPDAMNAIQEELCNAVTSLGLTLNKAQTTQLAQALALLAPLLNPSFTGVVHVPTPAPGDSSASAANTAWTQQTLFGATTLSGAYTFALADVGQTFVAPFDGGTLDWTIPAHAAIPIAAGARIYGAVQAGSVVQLGINSDFLYYPAGGLGGYGVARTITGPAMFTLCKYSATGWFLDASNGVT